MFIIDLFSKFHICNTQKKTKEEIWHAEKKTERLGLKKELKKLENKEWMAQTVKKT